MSIAYLAAGHRLRPPGPAAALVLSLLYLTAMALPAADGAAPHDHNHDHGHDHAHDHTAGDGIADRLPADAPWTPALDFGPLQMLAVQEGGRKKPLDTVAIESIGKITGKALFSGNPTFKDPATGQSVSAMDLFVALWLEARDMESLPFVLVGSHGFRQAIGLNTNPEQKLFAPKELMAEPCHGKWLALAQSAHQKRQKQEPVEPYEKEAFDLLERLSLKSAIQNWSLMAMVPHPNDPQGTWTMGSQAPYPQADLDAIRNLLIDIRTGYIRRNNADFATASLALADKLRNLSPTIYPEHSELAREMQYNHLHPFRYAWLLYLASALFMLAIFRSKNKALYASAVTIFAAAFLMQSYGIYLRCMIAGRPPVTNMYESVVWVGAGCAAFGLIFELIYRPKYYLVAAGLMSVLTLIVADMVPVISDAGKSIGPLVPVLRDNFWLTVHVLTITLSYAAFTLAWSLGHITLFKHLIHPATTAEHKSLHGFLYQVLALGVLLLAIGTILGGVWANYSWGRFWGWDPKETWALIALLTYLFVLHGRFTGLWGQFGLSVGAVICYLSVLMAWYGVNFVLGTGLHSYGFGGGGLPTVATFCTIDLLFVGAVLLRRMQAPKPETPEAASVDPADEGAAETGGWHDTQDGLPQKS